MVWLHRRGEIREVPEFPWPKGPEHQPRILSAEASKKCPGDRRTRSGVTNELASSNRGWLMITPSNAINRQAYLGFARANEHRRLFQLARPGRRTGRIRLFTLSQGQMEARFRPGFGVLIVSTEPPSVATQVLNLNEPAPELKVRHKTTIEYVRDDALETPMKPLFQRAAEGMVLVEGKDVEDDGVHVLTVCPGAVRTPFFDAEAPRRLPPVALRSVTRPEGLADAIFRSLARGRRELTYPRAIVSGYIVRALAPGLMRRQVKRVTLGARRSPRRRRPEA